MNEINKLKERFIDNLFEAFLLLGVFFVSIGCFIFSIIMGFVITGLLLMGISVLIYKDKGGE